MRVVGPQCREAHAALASPCGSRAGPEGGGRSAVGTGAPLPEHGVSRGALHSRPAGTTGHGQS